MTQGMDPDINPRFSKQAPGVAPGEELILTPAAIDFIVKLNDVATELDLYPRTVARWRRQEKTR